ncbi:uncharacterized protein LOC122966251 isoform X1 [Scomber scombrus]|uniref:Uncharacterized protein LOC122966251 isoform X1 n=1 Tax=Scomber scombrus TaxID=13677 RepID=A0AAV1NL96_SCOSC
MPFKTDDLSKGTQVQGEQIKEKPQWNRRAHQKTVLLIWKNSHQKVLFLALMLEWMPVFPAPTHSCDAVFSKLKDITSLMTLETEQLLDKYKDYHNIEGKKAPTNAPDSSISGKNNIEKLQDIYIKNILFHLHISQEKANGKNIGTWPPGFPKLQVHQNSPNHWAKVQCSLLFMAQGLKKLLEDQKNNLNPNDLPLHEKLSRTISRVNMLATCVKDIHKEKCSSTVSPPTLPKSAFDRKQWGHTLLVASRDYLEWLEHQFGVKGPNQIKHKAIGVTFKKYFEGSGYFL